MYDSDSSYIGVISVSQVSPPQRESRGRRVPYKVTVMTTRATGIFEVTLTPQLSYNQTAEAKLGRMSIDKLFRGDLEARSQGEMLSAATEVKGSAGYVAIERVTGVLQGRTGAFTLQHNGTLKRGAPQLTVSVVPDSGTDELAGLTGNMKIPSGSTRMRSNTRWENNNRDARTEKFQCNCNAGRLESQQQDNSLGYQKIVDSNLPRGGSVAQSFLMGNRSVRFVSLSAAVPGVRLNE